MDLYASAALTGIGYALNKERDSLKRSDMHPSPNDMPSMKNMYESDYWTTARAEERQRGQAMWHASQTPFESGVAPRPAYASQFSGIEQRAQPQTIRTLAGTEVSSDQFMHNNMQPYFRGTVKQSLDPFVNESRLERMTGRGDLYQHKKEVESFFEPTAGFANVCGMADNGDFYLDRVTSTKARNNDLPFEQIRVGKGLGMGFTADPAGGFQQANTLDFARPKNVDELRVATKPRLVYELPVQGPKKAVVTERGLIGEVSKNRPEKTFEQTEDNLLRTTGAVLKDTERPVIDMKPTARVDTHVEYKGQAGHAAVAGKGADTDYGKSAMSVFDNERMSTQKESVLGNLTTAVKSIISPLLDVFRSTTKEYVIDAPREFGNMHAQIPEKATTYDPVMHAMRTTIKETLIHDTTINNLKGPTKVTAALEDEAKKTIRQTTPIQESTRNVAATTYRVTIYNVDAVAKKTVRETTKTSGSQYGFIGGAVTEGTGAYDYIKVELPNTQKQFISDVEYEGIAGSKADFRPMSEEDNRNAEIDGTREALNVAAGHTPNAGGAYTGVDAANVHVDPKKLISDSMAARTVGNVTRIVSAEVPSISDCDVTRPAVPLPENDRLDGAILGSLHSNPYNISVNPF